METIKQTHDLTIFSGLVEILISSGLGEKDYGLAQNHHQTRYEDLAKIMNKEGYSNRDGNPLNRNTLKQVVHRVKSKEDYLEKIKPDWSWFEGSSDRTNNKTQETSETCLVCNTAIPREYHKTCSAECGKVYQEHKNAPCDPKFPSAFHQMRYEESFSKINH